MDSAPAIYSLDKVFTADSNTQSKEVDEGLDQITSIPLDSFTSTLQKWLYAYAFVWFDSLRPINNLSGKQGWVFLGWTSTKLG